MDRQKGINAAENYLLSRGYSFTNQSIFRTAYAMVYQKTDKQRRDECIIEWRSKYKELS